MVPGLGECPGFLRRHVDLGGRAQERAASATTLQAPNRNSRFSPRTTGHHGDLCLLGDGCRASSHAVPPALGTVLAWTGAGWEAGGRWADTAQQEAAGRGP